MNSTPTQPTPSLLGTLSTLPRELRSQIYSHVLSPVYHLLTQKYLLEPPPDDRFADLAILRLSSAINAEVSADLFSMSTFVFSVGFWTTSFRTARPLPTKTVTKKVQKVKFEVATGTSFEARSIERVESGVAFYFGDQSKWPSDVVPMVTSSGQVRGLKTIYHSEIVDPKCEASIGHFAGCDTERNELCVIFNDFDKDFHLFMSTPFFRTLKTCTGFRTIRVVAECWNSSGSEDFDRKATEEMVEKVKKELEGCWGNCVVRAVDGHYCYLGFATEMVFRPLNFCRQ